MKFKLYGGQSEDGRGAARYLRTTTDVNVAKKHYDKVYNDPYSTGKVVVQYDDKEDDEIGQWTDWESLGLVIEKEKEMRYWLYKEGTDRLVRGSHGDSGGMSRFVYFDALTKTYKVEENAKPRVGGAIQVGSPYPRQFCEQDFWQTTLIVEILEDSENYVKFLTENGSIYEWKIL
jgi:hypothetical protein